MPEGDARIETLLDAVHDALMAGDVAALAPLAEALEHELDGAGPAGADLGHAVAMRLRDKAARNAANLAAVRRGLRAASRRIAEIASAARSLQTYDMQGRRHIVTPAEGEVARRM